MSGIVLLIGQVGIVMGGFIGASRLLHWYHMDSKDRKHKNEFKGVDKNDKFPFNR